MLDTCSPAQMKLAKDPLKETVHKGGFKVLAEAASKSFEARPLNAPAV